MNDRSRSAPSARSVSVKRCVTTLTASPLLVSGLAPLLFGTHIGGERHLLSLQFKGDPGICTLQL
ncbi:hypothetical protein DM02DRAFT_608482 [Periconia macrospinosa]|uniref:Uncharacterized protein n=1 Tax=Periconia macrospinosa TaxID=97972 RepID=A0A2V1EEX7_9PLEO|nr:hypothetical protein DM02DRAFT_608482 [Periconia macrospinosa]